MTPDEPESNRVLARRLVPYEGPCPRCGGELTDDHFARLCPACFLSVEPAVETIEECQ